MCSKANREVQFILLKWKDAYYHHYVLAIFSTGSDNFHNS